MTPMFVQGLEGFDGFCEGAREDLADVEQVAGNEDEIDSFGNGVGHDVAEHAEEIFVAFNFA